MLIGPLESDPEAQGRVSALRDGLEKLGWNDGRNVRIDVRWGGDAERLKARRGARLTGTRLISGVPEGRRAKPNLQETSSPSLRTRYQTPQERSGHSSSWCVEDGLIG